jgi:hypothetical protein
VNTKLLTTAAAALGCLAVVAPAALADVNVSSFSISPSTTQAGGNPDVTLDAKFSSSTGDTVKDATVSLAPGLLADPSAPTRCSASDFQNQTCPSSSRIGDGKITGTAPAFGTTVKLPIQVYLVAPQGTEIARIGVIADFFDTPAASLTAPVQLRTSPTVGIDIPLTGIPNQVSGTDVRIDELSLRLFGTVNGRAFTRNPTSCSPATTSLTIDSYDVASPVGADATFTPTGCNSLTYAPQLTARAAVDQGDDGVEFSATVTQSPGDAATSEVSMTLPAGLSPRLSALGGACSAADLSSCPSIGTATVTTPLLPGSLQGQLVLAAGPAGALPTIDAVFGPPLSLTLVGTPSLAANGLVATFSGLPDVPITSLGVDFAGGANSILTAGSDLCSQPQTLAGDFVAQSGAGAHVAASVTVDGTCPTGGPVTSGGSSGPTASSGAPGPTGSKGSSRPGASGSHKSHHRKRHHKRHPGRQLKRHHKRHHTGHHRRARGHPHRRHRRHRR